MNFHLGHFMFFSLCLFLSVEVLVEADPNMIYEIFHFILSFFFSLCTVIYPKRKSDRIKTQKRFFLVFFLSVGSLLVANPNEF
jgi:hypothetical protein